MKVANSVRESKKFEFPELKVTSSAFEMESNVPYS